MLILKEHHVDHMRQSFSSANAESKCSSQITASKFFQYTLIKEYLLGNLKVYVSSHI